MNEQQVFNAVMIAADCRERLARTWEAATERYFRLADSLPLCSFDRAKAAAHATNCQAFADQLRDAYPNVKKFYREVAQDHLAIAQKFQLTPYHALFHMDCADKAFAIAETL